MVEAALCELVLGYRILGSNRIGLGVLAHLTMRSATGDSFWTYQFGQSVEEVRLSDLREVDFDLQIRAGGGRVNRNLGIHCEIYRAYPNIGSILHHHGDNGIALGAIGSNVVPFDRNAARWHEAIALVDDYESPILAEQGASIAHRLGSNQALLLKHHGVLVVGGGVRDTVIGAIELERTCRVQLKAMAAGALHLLPDPEIADARAGLAAPGLRDANWDYHMRVLARDGLDADLLN